MTKFILLILTGLGLSLSACGAGSAPVNIQQVSLQAAEFKFDPASIEVTAGRPVKITLVNGGGLDHEWSIPKIPATGIKAPPKVLGHVFGGKNLDLELFAMAGASADLEFTPTAPGKYDFFCSVEGHKEAGMVGTLIVK